MSHHRRKLGGALFLTLVFIACCVISYSFAWYRIVVDPATSVIKAFTTYYFWAKARVVYDDNTEDAKDYTYDSDSDKNVKAVFTTSLTFLTVGAGVGILTAIFQIIAIISKSKIFRLLSAIAAMAAAALLAVSFFTFFKINKAFDDDGHCVGQDVSDFFTGETTEIYCNKFMGSKDGTLSDLTWGPYVGWWVLIGGILFGVLSSICTFLA
ncbi:hypothetical protein DLAC_09597 [Tieghemostelium lacteum]|uniref:Transmembrane protein n=1 Tax=Tieghemostelium lacteum TaxID=361077 RepID=A0A151Z6P8_TIELA|nr:hypothetical protein DLAC_09597 [Tieghemostelium lacteum]|eukprot:KYQ89632.1 hypothetical protein DLAC_09597 [Tieghemostelium lacteum]